MSHRKESFRVLMELRPCFEGFAGIPQETRLVFCALNTLEDLEVTGLINHGSRHLRNKRWKSPRRPGPLSNFHALHIGSRLALSTKDDLLLTTYERIIRLVDKALGSKKIELLALFGREIRITPFDGSHFGDFLWQSLFSNSLPASDFDVIRTAVYASIQPPWKLLNKLAAAPLRSFASGPAPRLASEEYDVFISQTPWPTLLHHTTQLVVRYHDAVPVFLPHTIKHAGEQQLAHMAGLRLNQRRGVFVCTSDATRSELLKIMPFLEKRSLVIPDMVSKEYYPETGDARYISSVIRGNICDTTEPGFLTTRDKERFYATHLDSGPVRFLIMVSTLEPRKNHMKLLGAWDYLVQHGFKDLKLLLVGSLGWEYDKIIKVIKPRQEQGRLFHLERVPAGQLRVLYSAAAAVVCPSVCEGFDLSGIEAMLSGGVVVASDIPVHREIYSDACEYFNPYSTNAQAEAVRGVITQPGRREELIASGLRHASQFKSETILPKWDELFRRIRSGDFKKGHAYDK